MVKFALIQTSLGNFAFTKIFRGNAGYKYNWAYAKFMKCFYAGLEQQFFKYKIYIAEVLIDQFSS